MALFYRRSLQQMLDNTVGCFSHDQLTKFVNNLNREDDASLGYEWELALLDAVNAFGIVEYEPEGLARRPDFKLVTREDNIAALIDVTTISDQGLEAENPRHFFRVELERRLKKRGFNVACFTDEPASERIGVPRDQKVHLLYPAKSDVSKLYGEQFNHFLDYIDAERPDKHECNLIGSGFQVRISYNSAKKNVSYGHLAYTIPYSLTRNPLFRGLEKKRKQLRSADAGAIQGIFVCDGGCHLLRQKMRDPLGRTYMDSDVVYNFFEKTTSISFVQTFYVDRREKIGLTRADTVHSKLFVNPKARFALPASLSNRLLQMTICFPPTKRDGWNAANHLRNGWDGPQKGNYIGWHVEGWNYMKIKISSRALLDLMSGRISHEAFIKECPDVPFHKNLFEGMLAQGNVISSSQLIRQPDKDDDHLEFTFSWDPAAAELKNPQVKE